jgi:hypothetical protein
MGSVAWKRLVLQKVLQIGEMKKKRVKFKLSSAEKWRVKECGMKLKKSETGGCRRVE